MKFLSLVIVLVATLVLGSTLEVQSVVDTYENTKIVKGSKGGTTYYPNTDLFPVGGRLYGISFSVQGNIDRIDWDIVDVNDKKLHLQMGSTNRIINKYFYLPEGSTIQSVRIHYIDYNGTYNFVGLQFYGSNGQYFEIYGSNMYKARYYGQIDFEYPLIGFYGLLDMTIGTIRGLGFIMVRRNSIHSPEYLLEDIPVKKSVNETQKVDLLRTNALPSLQTEGTSLK